MIIRTFPNEYHEALQDLEHLQEKELNYKYFNDADLREAVDQQFESELLEYATLLKGLVEDLDSQEMIASFLSEFPQFEDYINE